MKISKACLAQIMSTHSHPGFHGPVFLAQPILWGSAAGGLSGTDGRCAGHEGRT